MEWLDMNEDDINKMIATHPLTVFSKLVADSPGNKVYQLCLDKEINQAAMALVEKLPPEMIACLERLFSSLPEHPANLEYLDDEMKDLLMSASIVRKVLAKAREIRQK